MPNLLFTDTTLKTYTQKIDTRMNTKMTNNNILINSDFRTKSNIINQRELNTYIGRGYTIDGWFSNRSENIMNILDNGFQITTSNTNANQIECNQSIEFPNKFRGMNLTLSIIASEVNAAGANIMISYSYEGSSEIFLSDIFGNNNRVLEANKLKTLTVSIPDIPLQYIRIFIRGYDKRQGDVAGTNYTTFSRCKLEVGNVSTLLNDSPQDYGTELLKCQRYLYKGQGYLSREVAGPSVTTYTMWYSIEVPVTMRIVPAILNPERLLVKKVSDETNIDVNSFRIDTTIKKDRIPISAIRSSAWPDNNTVLLSDDNQGPVLFSAEM